MSKQGRSGLSVCPMRVASLNKLTKPAADLIDGRLDKARADAFPTAITLAIVGDEGAIPLDRGVELLDGFEELVCRGIARDGHRPVHVHREDSDLVERFIDVAMPQ